MSDLLNLDSNKILNNIHYYIKIVNSKHNI